MDDDELVFVEPLWPVTFEHMRKDLGAFRVEQFRYCCDVDVLAAIIDDCEFLVVEYFASDSVFHNIYVIHPFRWDHSWVVQLNRCLDFAKKASERLYPSALEMG